MGLGGGASPPDEPSACGASGRFEQYKETALKYASGRNVPVLAILGEDERARGEVAVRDLQTRQQDAAPRATAAQEIARRVRIEAT